MVEQTVKTIEKNHINFHFVPTDKFKTITAVAKFKAPLMRDTVTKRALLPFVLKQGTKHHRSEKELQMRLDELYGALLHITTTKKGESDILHFQLEFANEKFIEQSGDITNAALKLFHEVIFSPLIENDMFDNQIVIREKRQLENKINAIYDNKVAYANERLIDEMYKEEPFSLHIDGYVDELESIDGQQLANYYEQMIAEDELDIYVLGDFEVEEIEGTVTNLFIRQTAPKQTVDISEAKRSHPIEPKKVVEADAIQQAKLHIGYRTNILYDDDQYSALQVFNGLFGAFPNSKLFMNVREKHSLAYYIASRIESHIGLLMVYGGVETSEYENTYTIIAQQLEEIRQGNFTETELTGVQELIVSNVKETLDHPGGTIELLYQQVLGKKQLTPQLFIKQIEQVTKEAVIKVANEINLDTIYVLAGKAGE